MGDLISRDEVYKAFEDVLDMDFPYVSEWTPRERIEEIPSALIRCKDCKHFQIDGNFMFCNSEGSMFADVTESDFCSYAERKTE